MLILCRTRLIDLQMTEPSASKKATAGGALTSKEYARIQMDLPLKAQRKRWLRKKRAPLEPVVSFMAGTHTVTAVMSVMVSILVHTTWICISLLSS